MLNSPGAEGSPSTDNPPSTSGNLFLMLGASNLSRMVYSLEDCLTDNLPGRRVELLTALGPGRGYVEEGGLLTLSYPPIRTSPCFTALKQKRNEGLQAVALLTDIGNDLMYNVTARQLTDCLQEILDRLKEQQCPVVATPIPKVLLDGMSPERFQFLKRYLYPSSNATFEETLEGIRTVNEFLAQQDSEHMFLLKGLDAYMGWDLIHFDWCVAYKAWTRLAWALLEQAHALPETGVSPWSMGMAYCENAVRLVSTDFFKLRSRSPEFM